MRQLGLTVPILSAVLSLPTPAAAAEQGEKLRPVKVTAQTQIFNLPFCGKNSLSIELPTAYQVMRWQRVDFDLFAITENRLSKQRTELRVYIGHAPDERHPPGSPHAEGRVVGQSVEWYSWSEETSGETIYLNEALLNLFPIEVKRPSFTLGQRLPPPPPPPPPPALPRCEEGISLHLLAQGFSREAVKSAAALAGSLRKQ